MKVWRQIAWGWMALTLTCAAPPAFPAPGSRNAALADLSHAEAGRRAEAVAWLAEHGRNADQPRLLARLRDDDPDVRGLAEQALWRLWMRSGDAKVDRLMQAGVEQMQAGRRAEAIATFTEIIRRKPGFAEGWNKRATVHYLAGNLKASLADCDQVMKRNPHHFGALSGYGQIYFQLEDLDKAVAYWKRALDVNPNMPGVELNLRAAEALLARKRQRSI